MYNKWDEDRRVGRSRRRGDATRAWYSIRWPALALTLLVMLVSAAVVLLGSGAIGRLGGGGSWLDAAEDAVMAMLLSLSVSPLLIGTDGGCCCLLRRRQRGSPSTSPS